MCSVDTNKLQQHPEIPRWSSGMDPQAGHVHLVLRPKTSPGRWIPVSGCLHHWFRQQAVSSLLLQVGCFTEKFANLDQIVHPAIAARSWLVHMSQDGALWREDLATVGATRWSRAACELTFSKLLSCLRPLPLCLFLLCLSLYWLHVQSKISVFPLYQVWPQGES